MKKSLNIAAAALLLGSSAVAPLAFAQDATTPAAPASPGMQTPADPGATTEPTTKTMPAPDTSAANTGATGEYLTQQTDTQVSANEFIGQPIYNAENENIGDINDLIIEEKGGIVAAVVGVGGFLGIGEKDVAVPMDKITITHEADSNDVKLTTMETAEALKAAPEFQSLDDQKSANDSTMTPTDSTTTSSTDNN
ncbi:PRC-barrel domain-containing protein [Ciceribacter ferrooxidans]|uniref:Photosystem reaction center subunit H n=1 Tax=Ciceribacter ferrooxidans TaxID=2509717 RepID=A0A4V1RLU6_9HYPH|nr:PRC-barrel domain-containing protein [Ciceribacter ferrooxidans]RYB97050.1 photosystem reaction center subunit H [Ciceribacter ferrooxidans]